MDFISDRVSVDRSKGRLSVVISARLPRMQEALLVAWAMAWLFIGAYVAYSIAQTPAGRERQFLFAFMAFWLYFALRVGRVTLWRLRGFESIRVKDGVLTLKNSIFGYGRAREHFVENISGLALLEVDPRSWKWQLNESFWVMGGERLRFETTGRQVVFGKGLNADEAARVLATLKAELAKAPKVSA